MSTVAPSSRVSDALTPAGGQTDLAAGFPQPASGAAGVFVWRRRADVVTILTSADFSLTAVTANNFTARLNVATVAGDIYRVVGLQDPARNAVYVAGKLDSAALEAELTKYAQINQETRRDLSRAMVSPYGEDGVQLPDANTRKGTLLAFDKDTGMADVSRTLDAFDADVSDTAAARADVDAQAATVANLAAQVAASKIQTDADAAATAADRTAVAADRALTQDAVTAFTALTGDLGLDTVADVAAAVHDDATSAQNAAAAAAASDAAAGAASATATAKATVATNAANTATGAAGTATNAADTATGAAATATGAATTATSASDTAEQNAVIAYVSAQTIGDFNTDLTGSLADGDYAETLTRLPNELLAATLGRGAVGVFLDVGTDIPGGTLIEGWALPLQLPAGADRVDLLTVSRPLTDAGANLAGPGSVQDTVIETVSQTVTQLNAEPGFQTYQDCWFPVTPYLADATLSYGIAVVVYDGLDHVLALGWGQSIVGGLSQRRCGYYKADTGTASWSNFSLTRALAVRAGKRLYTDAASDSVDLEPIAARQDDVLAAAASGWTVLAARVSNGSFLASSQFSCMSAAIVVGTDVAVGTLLEGVQANLQAIVNCDAFTLKIIERGSFSETVGLFPRTGGDRVRRIVAYTPADLGLTTGAAATKLATLPFAGFKAQAGMTYIAQIDATYAGARAVFGIDHCAGAGLNQDQRGTYRNSAGTAAFAAGTVGFAISWVKRAFVDQNQLRADLDTAETDIDDLQARLAPIEAALPTSPVVRLNIEASSNYGTADFRGFAAMADVMTAGTAVKRLKNPQTSVVLAAAVGKLWLYNRPVGNDLTLVPGQAGDIVLPGYPATYAPADIGLHPGDPIAEASWEFPSTYLASDAYRLMWAWRWYQEDGVTPADCTCGEAAAGAAASGERGFYTNSVDAWAHVGSTTRVAYSLEDDAYDVGSETTPYTSRPEVADAAATLIGLDVTVTATLIEDGVSTTVSGTVSHAPTTITNVASEAINLTYKGAVSLMPYLTKTAHAWLSNVVVTPATAVVVNTRHGGLNLANNVADVAAHVAYKGCAERYDLIVWDIIDQDFAIVQGTERTRDASQFLPVATASTQIPLFNVLVAGNGLADNPIAIWAVDRGVHRDALAEWTRQTERNREILTPWRRAARAGQGVDVMFEVDSIQAQQNGVPDDGTPNGAHRDRATSVSGFLTGDGILGSDVYDGSGALPAIPSNYDHGDGAGAVHTRFGIGWHMVSFMAAESGYTINDTVDDSPGKTVNVYNFAVAGSKFDNSDGDHGGTGPIRQGAIVDQIGDTIAAGRLPIVHCLPGMNELSHLTLEDELNEAFGAYTAAGALIICHGTPRPNAENPGAGDQWIACQKIIRRVCEFWGAAHISTLLLCGPQTDTLGISGWSTCGTNDDNHPTPYEINRIGAAVESSVAL